MKRYKLKVTRLSGGIVRTVSIVVAAFDAASAWEKAHEIHKRITREQGK